jgi:hypothetical protein
LAIRLKFKAAATLGNGCATLDLPYAAPLNLVTNRSGLPIEKDGRVIDGATNLGGLPSFAASTATATLFDDSFLRDTRLKPLPHPGSTQSIDRTPSAFTCWNVTSISSSGPELQRLKLPVAGRSKHLA